MIISGGYGAVLGAEPIGRYDAKFRASAWPDDLIERCLAAYVSRRHISEVVAFAAATTDYAKPLRRATWPLGVRASLLTPAVQGGGAGSSDSVRHRPGHRNPRAKWQAQPGVDRGRRHSPSTQHACNEARCHAGILRRLRWLR